MKSATATQVQPASTPTRGVKPTESRRWLKPRLPREQLYRLSPARPKRMRLGVQPLGSRAQHNSILVDLVCSRDPTREVRQHSRSAAIWSSVLHSLSHIR